MKTFETFEKSPPLGMSFPRILQIVAVCGSPEMVECMAKWQETEWDSDCEICELLLVEELKGLEVKTATALYLAAFLDRTEMVCSLVTYSSENNMGFCFRTLKLSEPTEKVFMMDLAEKIKLKHFDIQPATVIPGHRMDKCRGRTRVYIVYSVLVVKASTYELEDLGHVMLVNPYKITQEVDDDARERMSVSNEETNRAQKALSKHRQKLWTEHSNLNIIRIARFKHQNHGKGIIEKTCIELFCSTKGVVPLGEQEFPKRLDIGNGDFLDVNVREGYFRYGAYDTLPSSSYHPTLKMGCNVGRSTPEYDQGHILQSVGGTLGPFVRYGSEIGFLSCAHVFFNIKNPAQPLDYYFNGRDKIKVVQPSLDTPGNHGIPIPCGYVHRAIFNPQLNPSVDVTVVELRNRIPNHGRFANNSRNSYKKAGFDELPEFNNGWLETNVRNIAASQTVFKFGSVSDVTRGVLDVSGCDVRPLSTILGLPRNTGAAHMINQYQVFGVYPSLSFFLEGDSGSAVFMKEPVRGELVCIGMAIGHTNVDINKFPSTVVTPIGAILNALGPQYTLASFP
ncbi:uncharacterized protein [Argopecten irradians]|uniref:uncharacterized protein n=1 Tax=Argopecten irradians TaxID=31199 RepID=UPI003724BE19